jgi:hypothetical protein
MIFETITDFKHSGKSRCERNFCAAEDVDFQVLAGIVTPWYATKSRVNALA